MEIQTQGRYHDVRKMETTCNSNELGDLALIAGCGIIGAGLALWYWLLCMIWAYRKSKRMGVSSALWVLAAVFFNLAAIAALYFYAVLKGTCNQCGRIRPGSSKYCDRCGKSFGKECPDCGQTVDIKADYCGNCGKKLSEADAYGTSY